MSDPVITRFAPSPTGFLHIGGARTALFNWAYAKAKGGKFLLRIEDTDRARSSQEAIEAIHQGLSWLGLEADEPAMFQSQRQDRHVKAAHQLLAGGHAYYSLATDEEIEAVRSAAREAGVAARYPGRDDPLKAQGLDGAVLRFKAPLEGETIVHDQVQGDVVVRNDQLDDLVLLRSDGTPTYMLAVVVDDHEMGITRVIRGDDHLTNCARQVQIYKALEWSVPIFAHIPLIHGADGAKLSKRHGALGAEHYQALGYLPEAMCNYLARLGWAHGDDEFISREQLISWFEFSGINKAPARFDLDKLNHINSHYLRDAYDDQLIAALQALLALPGVKDDLSFDASLIDFSQLKPALVFLKERAKTLLELLDASSFLFVDPPFHMDEKAGKIVEGAAVKSLISDLTAVFLACESWDKPTLEAALKGFAVEKELKFGKIAPALRVVLTGQTVSPGIYDVLYSLGREKALGRLKHFLTD